MSGSGVFASSFWLLIRTHNRARCQAEIPLIAPSEIVEPSLPPAAVIPPKGGTQCTHEIEIASEGAMAQP